MHLAYTDEEEQLRSELRSVLRTSCSTTRPRRELRHAEGVGPFMRGW